MTDKEKAYLEHKHTGGESNEKGNRYESYYAVWTIVRLLNQYRGKLDKVSIQSQVPMTYLDDLLVVEPSINTYHQIKNVKGLRWTTGKNGHSLKMDFIGQRNQCKERKESFALKLVYSDKNSPVGTKPRGLKKYTTTEFFPAKDINALVVGIPQFQSELRNLLYMGDRLPLDRLTVLAKWILGVWCADVSKRPIGLDYLDSEIAKNMADYCSNVSVTISPQCKNIFDSMGVDYVPSGSKVNIVATKFTASVDWSDDLQNRIVAAHPDNIIELFTLL